MGQIVHFLIQGSVKERKVRPGREIANTGVMTSRWCGGEGSLRYCREHALELSQQ